MSALKLAWRSALGLPLYALALIASTGGTGLLVHWHVKTWATEQVVLAPVGGRRVIFCLAVSLLSWATARLLSKRPIWDEVLLAATALPIAVLMLLPARFAL
ncbi:MAG: hypothetical protein KKC79_06500 [Gammaproteobacteria bacterium]|nr:hypothetical protein [Gammaproteobacteria bacterium]MBU1441571.1 hypothetical protein [Gammaproteobacteria bacterium]MBU2288324.1 hypothetical protein [Gammaproteobacteria bacterium]MBU2408283.1 hypothetical protein [Gammaproteobacteria bacterium]